MRLFLFSLLLVLRSERQAALAGAVRKGRDAAVVLVARTVEDNAVDTSRLGTLSDQLADLLGLGGLVTGEAAQVGLHGRRRRERLAHDVVDHLDGDVLRGAGHDQARTLGGAVDLLTTADLTTQTRLRARSGVLVVRKRDRHGSLTSLSDLAADLLAGVTNTLALVGLGLAQLADVRGNLADELLVDPLHTELGGRLDGEGDAVGGVERDRVRVAELELQLGRTLGQDAVTHAHDLELLLVAVGHTDDHVVDQGAGQAVQSLALALVVGALDVEDAFALLDRDRRRNGVGQGALGALDRHLRTVDRDVDTGRDRDGELANTRHAVSSPSRSR